MHEEDDKDEYWIFIKFDWKVNPDTEAQRAVPAWEINQEFGSNYTFRHTIFRIDQPMCDVLSRLIEKK
ncbi:MAG: hypothetical protein JSR44_12390 [Spirochaetes bacterium]|nr:hypothetical protein [Spirochaetota bacterium]